MEGQRGQRAVEELEAEAIALAFGATVRALRLQAGFVAQCARPRRGVDPAYIHRMEHVRASGRLCRDARWCCR